MNSQSIVLLMTLSGLLLSFHPLTLSVFVALIAGAFGKNHQKSSVFTIAFSYILALSVVVGLLGLGISLLACSLSFEQLSHVGLGVGIVAVLWGLIGAKEYFWYGSKRTTPAHVTRILHNRTVKDVSPGSALILGFAAVYASILTIMVPVTALSVIGSLLRPTQPAWILFVVIGMIIPLIVILGAALRGLKLSAIIKWKEDNKAILRMSVGLLNVILGWIIFLLLNGSIGTVL